MWDKIADFVTDLNHPIRNVIIWSITISAAFLSFAAAILN